MKIRPLAKLFCAVLHPRHAPLDEPLLLEAARAAARHSDIPGEPERRLGFSPQDVAMMIGKWDVLISQSDAPLPMDTFTLPLNNPYNRMIFPQLEKTLHEHCAYTLISVGRGGIFAMEAIMDAVSEHLPQMMGELAITDLAHLRTATDLAAELCRFVMGRRPGLALHWSVSNQLLPPPMAEQYLEADMRLTLLNMAPVFYSDSGPLGPGRPLAAYFAGSEHLIGHLVDIKEAPLPPAEMAMIGHAFVQMIMHKGELIPVGHTFGPPDDSWRVAVRHIGPDSRFGLDVVRLEVIHAPAHGIRQS